MAFPPLGNSDHVVVSVSIDFPINSKQDTLFHCVAYDYSRADWDGLCDHLRDVPWEDIFKLSASAAASEFCEWVQVGIDVSGVSLPVGTGQSPVGGWGAKPLENFDDLFVKITFLKLNMPFYET